MGAEKPEESNVQFGPNPPLPQLTLRVGITGHRLRTEKLLPESYAFVKDRLRDVFAAVDVALAGVFASEGKCFSGGPFVRLVSGLAEGVDQFAVEVMPASWNLDAILPFPRVDYAKDFGDQPGEDGKTALEKYQECLGRSNTTVTQLPNERRGAGRAGEAMDEEHHADDENDPAYARLGGFLLRQVDILVAVWDGKPGKRGGTGEVVSAAAGAAIPVVRINSLSDRTARMVKGFDRDGNLLESDEDCCGRPLRTAIEAIVGFPKKFEPAVVEAGGFLHGAVTGLLRRGCRSTPAKESTDIPDRLQDYHAETWPSPFFSFYEAFKRTAERKRFRRDFTEGPEGYRTRWAPALQDELAVVPLRGQLEKLLLPRYVWADALAVAYSHCYRSAYIACYSLAAFAVGIALSSIIVHQMFHEGFLHAKAILVIVELFLIIKIMCIVSRGRSERWKEKWLEYRSLAELLFNMRFLSYLAEHGRTQRISKFDTSSDGWLLWYLAATIREVGLPDAVLDKPHQRAALDALKDHVVKSQHEWHIRNARTLQRMHRALHLTGEICFGVTVAMLVLFLLSYGFAFSTLPGASWMRKGLEDYAQYLPFFAAFLPALGAAVASIRTTGDFEKVAERSEKTVKALEALGPDIERVGISPTLDQTGDVMLRAASVLAEDLNSWHLVYGDKRLELPS